MHCGSIIPSNIAQSSRSGGFHFLFCTVRCPLGNLVCWLAGVHCDFLVSLVGVVSAVLGSPFALEDIICMYLNGH